MKTVLLVAADEREFAGIRRAARGLVRLQWPVGCSYGAELNDQRLILIANGPGRELAAEALVVTEERERIDVVVSTGFCGALNPKLEPGDIVVASKVRCATGASSFRAEIPETSRAFDTGTLVTIDRVAQTAEEKRQLRLAGADAVDMEAEAVAAAARKWGVPFFCIRAVTDSAGESFACDFNRARRTDGRFSGWRLLAGALKQPRKRLPELWSLRTRSIEAADALGEFIADCRF